MIIFKGKMTAFIIFVPFLALSPVRLPISISLHMNMQYEPLHGYGHTVSINICPSLLFICTGIIEQEKWKKKTHLGKVQSFS